MVAKRYWACVFALSLGAMSVLSHQSTMRGISRAPTQDPPRTLTAIAVKRSVAASRALSIPIAFEPSGVVYGGAQFVGRGKKMAVALTSDGIELRAGSGTSSQNEVASLRFLMRDRTTGARLVWRGEGKLQGESNYFIGNDAAKWRTHVPRFERAQANAGENRVVVYGNEEGIEYDLWVPPGADVSRLRLAIAGMKDVRVDANGDLVMRLGKAELRMQKPAVYEDVGVRRGAEKQDYETASGESATSNLKAETSTQNHTRASGDTPRPSQKSGGNSGSRRSHRSSSGRRGSTSRSTRAGRHRGRTGLARNHKPTAGTRGRNTRPRPDRPKNPDRPPRQMRGRRIEGGYVVETDGTIGFRVARRDPRATLVIDPSISVTYTSFLGGEGSETASSVVVDAMGMVYVGGTTTSPTTFPEATTAQVGPGIPSASAASNSSATEFFVAKIDPTQSGANSLVYLTFLGGSATQAGGLIAVDNIGDVAITGTTTSTDFPVTDGSARTSGSNDTTISEIDPSGSKLIFSTLFGGNGQESQAGAGGIAVDTAGNIFVASDTDSTNLPATTGAYATAYQSSASDGFLAIFQTGASPRLKYCTYLGLNGQVGVGGVAVDGAGNAYIAGFTDDPSANFPTTKGVQTAYGGGSSDAFLVKISPSGGGASDLVYATLLGGNGADQAFAVAVDSATPANAYVTGTTSSTNFPVNGGVTAYQASQPSNATSHTSDAFLSVIAQNASTGATSLAYSTYLGGSQTDAGMGVVAVAPYAVYVTGTANSWDFPWRDNLQPFNGYGDAFVAKLDTTSAGAASLIYSTPLGGTSPPGANAGAQGTGIALDASGNVWAAGQTTSADFPSAGNSGNGFQPICASCQQSPAATDAFVLAIQENSTQLPSLYFAGPGIPLNFGKQALGAINIPPQFAAIKNGGEAPLNIASIGITGPNSGDFALSSAGGCAPATISPGGMCSFEVNFTPTVVGAESAFVQVTSNAPGNPQVLQVVGVGVGLAALPASLNFGKQIAGTTSAPQSVTLSNTTSEPLFIDSIQESGPNAATFPPASGAGACVAQASGMQAGTTCEVSVTFAPTSAGTFQAEVDIEYHVQALPEQEQVIPLSGTGLAPAPVATLQPATINFGTISVGAAAQAQVITLTNTGSAALNLTTITIGGPNAADFGIVASGGSPCPVSSGSLAINAACTVGVQFKPQTAGVKSAALSFTDNATGSPQAVGLAGTAQTPPDIQIAPASLTFGSQSVGTKSVAQQVTITNSGGSALAMNGISVAGANAGDFSETNNCPPAAGAGANCTISVTFQPTAPGMRTASISIADDGPNSPQTVAVSGTGTQPIISFSPSSVNFGNQAAGTASMPASVTVSNSGTGALVIGKFSFSGANSGDFTESDNCSGSAAGNGIAPGGTCTIKITFTPACGIAPAARSVTLSVVDNAAGSPQSVALSGTATGSFCFIVPAGDLTSATISAGQTAMFALEVEAANGFTGNVNLACTGAPAAAMCAISPGSVNVGGSTLASIQVNVQTNVGTSAAMRRGPGSVARAVQKHMEFQISILKLEMMWAAILIAVIALARRLHAPVSGASTRSQRFCGMRFAMLAGAALLLIIGIVACGGGGSNSTVSDPGTPAGTYTITVTGTTSGGASQSIALTVVVQ